MRILSGFAIAMRSCVIGSLDRLWQQCPNALQCVKIWNRPRSTLRSKG